MLRIEMLPAAHGDAIWIEYGAASAPHRVLVDGGTPAAYKALKARIAALPLAERRFELLVITHIDADHIGGALALLEKDELGATYDDIWFNGFGHLVETGPSFEPFGAAQGERLTTALLDGRPWNEAFAHRAVCLAADGGPVVRTLAGGLELTLLSPTRAKLAELKPKWERECAQAGLDPQTEVEPEPAPGFEPMGPIDVDQLVAGPFEEDDAEANGSSIAFLAALEGKRVLFGADAHPSLLVESIERLVGTQARLTLDACKLPHHGSSKNVSPDLIRKLDCPTYLISTNGAQFHHPDRAALARVVRLGGPGVRLVFNYRTEFNAGWDDDDLRAENDYTTAYPAPGTSGAVCEL